LRPPGGTITSYDEHPESPGNFPESRRCTSSIDSLISHYSSFGEAIRANSAIGLVEAQQLMEEAPATTRPKVRPPRLEEIPREMYIESVLDEESFAIPAPRYRNRRIAVVVPAYNEELLIGETLYTVPDFVEKIYVVDDCSDDRTLSIIREYAKKDRRIVPIHHEGNQGVGSSIVSGYKAALADGIEIAAVMAGDNQMDPVFLPKLLDPIIDGKCDYTMGNRLISPVYRKGMSTWRFFGNSVLTFLTKMASGYWQMMDPQNGFTAISARALERISLNDVYPKYGYCNDLLVKLNVWGFRVINVPHPARYGREKSGIKYSSYIFKVSWLLLKDFLWRLKMKYVVLSFHPLVFYYALGAALSVLGVLGGVYALYFKFIMGNPIFVPAVLSLVVFGLGMQLLLFAMLFDMQQEKNGNGWYFAST